MSQGHDIRRRALLAGLGAGWGAGLARPAFAAPDDPVRLGPGAESGWAALDMASDRTTFLNARLHLPMCSSFKWLLAALVLARADMGRERLDRRIAFGRAELFSYAPATRAALERAGGERAELSVEALCAAAATLSDNTAANLLLATVGGPRALTAWLRTLGDGATRLDRIEPALNDVPRGDLRDTTTPLAMLEDLRRILYGPVLQPRSRARLFGWMLGCRTGETRLRAGLPPGWRIAHKTGTMVFDHPTRPDQRNAAGDVGVLLPPSGAPILLAAYTAGSRAPQDEVDRWFAELARTVARDVSMRRAGRAG